LTNRIYIYRLSIIRPKSYYVSRSQKIQIFSASKTNFVDNFLGAFRYIRIVFCNAWKNHRDNRKTCEIKHELEYSAPPWNNTCRVCSRALLQYGTSVHGQNNNIVDETRIILLNYCTKRKTAGIHGIFIFSRSSSV